MPYQVYVFFTLPCIIWGTSWFIIKQFQVSGGTAPMVSVGIRFLLAGVVIWAWLGLLYGYRTLKLRLQRRVTGVCLQRVQFPIQKLSFAQHKWLWLQGFTLFGTNYWLFYEASLYLNSAVVAIVFSLLTIMNLLNGVLFLKQRFVPFLLLPALMGVGGLCLIFIAELRELQLDTAKLKGLALALVATFSASLGNILSARNQRHQLSVTTASAYGMFYGGFSMLLLAWLSGEAFALELNWNYFLSLGYLTVFASVIAFYAYLTLLGMIGPAKAAYTALIFPLVALLISVLFEAYVLRWESGVGVLMVLFGNLVIFRTHKKTAPST